METVEDAYNEIAKALLHFINGRLWDSAVYKAVIYTDMVRSSFSLTQASKLNEQATRWPTSSIKDAEACRLLRDDLLKTTGHRAWGLTYTLLPTGKMNIEYSYDKPEDYDGD